MWVANKAMKIQRGDQMVDVIPGDPVPEAADWDNPKLWERQKMIRWDPGAVAPAAPAPGPAAELPKEEPEEPAPQTSRRKKKSKRRTR